MDLFKIKSKISHNIHSLVALNEIINKAGYKISNIELDLMMEKTKELYDLLIQLKVIGKQNASIELPKEELEAVRFAIDENKELASKATEIALETKKTALENTSAEEQKEEQPEQAKHVSTSFHPEVKKEEVRPIEPVQPKLPENDPPITTSTSFYPEVKPEPTPPVEPIQPVEPKEEKPSATYSPQEKPASTPPVEPIQPRTKYDLYESPAFQEKEIKEETPSNSPVQNENPIREFRPLNESVEEKKSQEIPSISAEKPEISQPKDINNSYTSTPNPPVNKEVSSEATPTQKIEIKPIEEDKKTAFDSPASIAERFLQTKDNSIAAKYQDASIQSLTKAIGLNERLLFIRELFNSRVDMYEHFIKELDSFNTYRGAMTFYSEMKVRYNWFQETDALKKLVELIERKFGL